MPFHKEENDFGTDRYVDGLIKFIKQSDTPITIALQGEWGSGKTSLMTRLKRALCSKPDAPFMGIEINTWEYSMMSTPEQTVYKIMEQLVMSFTPKNNVESKSKITKLFDDIRGGIFRGTREFMKKNTLAAVLVEVLKIPTDLKKQEDDEPTEADAASLAELRNELEKAVEKSVAEAGKRGVIVFVDDLDRLNPPVAVEILELLKNIFCINNCIFVLAIDYDVVVKGLEPKFGPLTDKNEREFRSFFDKIIQVPFSLPVSSYHPMDFVLGALVEIGYLGDINASDPNVKERFTAVVECSVGKNPRSIKRLINTLSLLECIAQSGDNQEKEEDINEKLLSFIIVAMQISYPQIYRLLVHKPAFTAWDADFARKEGITLDDKEIKWEDVLKAACTSNKYLTQHLPDIKNLFAMILENLDRTNNATEMPPETIGTKLKQNLDKSSVTGVNTGFNAEDFDKKDLIYKLHSNVMAKVRQQIPTLKYKLMRNTGNGGVYIWIDDNTRFDITFSPAINSKNEIALKLHLDFHLARPERMRGMSFDEIMTDPQLSSAISALDSVLAPLLKSVWYFKGNTYDGQPSYFTSLTDELRHVYNTGLLPAHEITNNPRYWIDLPKPSQFEDDQIVDTIAKVLIANYEFRKAMKNWK